MTEFLTAQAPKIAAQVSALLAKFGKANELTVEQAAIVDAVLKQINFDEWTVLADELQPAIEQIAKMHGMAALAQVGVDVETNPEVVNVVNEKAVAYASQRSAELVGMKYNAAGELVKNPNAEMVISESTREFVRADVETAMREGWTNKELADNLVDNYAFSENRAGMIARTETSFAANEGAMESYRASGVVEGKIWLTADDELVDEEICAANGGQGEIGLDDDFESGDHAPPAHPNCRCSIAPVVNFND